MRMEDFGKQVMIAIPVALVIQRNDEEVAALQGLQAGLGVERRRRRRRVGRVGAHAHPRVQGWPERGAVGERAHSERGVGGAAADSGTNFFRVG